ncbi:MAG: hypothetical protein FWF84_05535 [Kiritimatiellaeota bacterium]|nr:hypothetical protein [Kiritimatiellota bacterium]
MSIVLPKEEREYLRGLAKWQMEIAQLPVMAERRKRWLDMNDGVPGAPPPFAIETWTFDRDFMPESIFRIKSGPGRGLEAGFLRNIRQHELMGDDHVCPDTLDVGWHIARNEFGIDIKTEYVKDAEGFTLGYHFDCPLKDLANGFDQVKPMTFSVNRESTFEHKAFLEEHFGDIMPVVIRGHAIWGCPTQRLMRLMTMETFFMEMYDHPETLHRLMALLTANVTREARWAEDEGLLVLNNENQNTCGTCFNFTTRLPTRTIPPGGKVLLKDLWGYMDSQETVGLSPEMFNEFCFPYYKEISELSGRNYWGCCEPADPLWESSLSKLSNIGAVSISRWANQAFMAEALHGTGIVFSRKPDPNLLSVHHDLDEDAWRNSIRETLELVSRHGVPAEFVVRDAYSLKGNLGKLRRATDIAREEIRKVYE